MAKIKKEKPYLLLDDVKHMVHKMSDDQKNIYDHLVDLERKIQSTEFNLVQLRFGRQAFVDAYRSTLKPSVEV